MNWGLSLGVSHHSCARETTKARSTSTEKLKQRNIGMMQLMVQSGPFAWVPGQSNGPVHWHLWMQTQEGQCYI